MPYFDAERQVEGRQIKLRLDEIRGGIYSKRKQTAGWESVVTGNKQGPNAPPESGWEPFQIGSVWGGKDVTMWFRAAVSIQPR